MNPIIIQTIYYAAVMVLTLVVVGLLQRGFFWKFFRVKVSFGKYILCKIRAVNRDYFRVGRIEEGFLVYKSEQGKKRIPIKDNSVFYRSIGPAWVDVDEEKNALGKHDYSTVSGFDAIKYNDLFLRALHRPKIADNKEKIVIGCLVLIIVAIAVVGFFIYKQDYSIQFLGQQMELVKEAVKQGVIVGGS